MEALDPRSFIAYVLNPSREIVYILEIILTRARALEPKPAAADHLVDVNQQEPLL